MAIKGLGAGKRAALVVSEVQNGITNLAYTDTTLSQQVAARGIVPKINALAGEFRTRGLPVVHCLISARKGFAAWDVNCVLAARIAKEGKLETGTDYAAIHDDITVAATDYVSERHTGMSPFTGTDLDPLLRAERIDTVVFAGVSTNIALVGGSIEAIGLGYVAVIAEDCTSGGTAESHQIQITMHLPLISTVSTSDAIVSALG